MITNARVRSLVDVGEGPVKAPSTLDEKEAVRKQLIAQQEFVRTKAFANLSHKGMLLAFDAAADMRWEDRRSVLAFVFKQPRIRRREIVSIAKMVHRIHRRISNPGMRINWGAAVQYPAKKESLYG